MTTTTFLRRAVAAAMLGAAGMTSATGALGAQQTPAAAAPALRLARLFADGLVVQRDAPITVWGWAAPGARVTVRLDARSAGATAGADGRWQVRLPALPAGGPHTITAGAAGARVTVRDVLAGDVWIASGQSNMEWPLRQAANGAQAIAAARDSGIREFKVPISWAERPADDLTGGSWAPADPQHVGDFSAVAYFFARELRATPALRGVPIGIVNATWGGSGIETWLSAGSQGLGPDGPARALAAEHARLDSLGRALRARLGDVQAKDPGLVDGRAVWADPALDESAWRPIRVPGDWESQGYAGMDGVAWYRTTFPLTADDVARGARLVLGPIDDDDVTWVNGVEVGRTSGYNRPRTYEVPASALRAGRNVLAIRVSDYGGGGGITGSPTPPRLVVGGADRPLAGEWKLRVGELALSMDGQRLNKVPAITYNRMVHPLLPIAARGFLWYQGESNANDAAQAAAYRGQFATLIRSWRSAFGGGRAGDLPFLWVQLPNYGRADSVPAPRPAWAVLREAMDAALALPNTGRAVTIDLGEADDIHPRNKEDVGRRLALVGRRVAYGEKVEDSGPTYRDHRVEGGRVRVRFGHLGGGLTARGDAGGVGGFTIAGADRRFVPAQARIEGDQVIVWSDRVGTPVAVRYAWADNPATANLYGRAGLPAAPFRTDRW